jgi:hypothetical protein
MGDNNIEGEGNNNDDNDDNDDDDSTTTSGSYTVLYGTDWADSFPTTFAALADLSVNIHFLLHYSFESGCSLSQLSFLLKSSDIKY